MSQTNYTNLLNEYENSRESAKNGLTSRKDEIYCKIPRIKEIDAQIGEIGLNVAKAILSGSDSSALLEELHQKTVDLQIERGELLTSNNYPLDYLTIKYTCKQCQDTGYVNNQKCNCFKQKIINNMYKTSNLSNFLMSQNFDNFDFNCYSDKKDAEHNTTPRENMKEIYKACLDFTGNFDETSSGLLFTGPTGIGKTFLSSCIAKELLDKGKTVYYQTAFRIFDMLEDYQFNKSNAVDKNDLDIIFSADLLIIDDLGTEFMNSYTKSELFNIINSRLLGNKKTIISTNLNLNELQNMYSERVASRIVENFEVLDFFGEDIRINKNVL